MIWYTTDQRRGPVFHKHLGESSILSGGTKRNSTSLFWISCSE